MAANDRAAIFGYNDRPRPNGETATINDALNGYAQAAIDDAYQKLQKQREAEYQQQQQAQRAAEEAARKAAQPVTPQTPEPLTAGVNQEASRLAQEALSQGAPA